MVDFLKKKSVKVLVTGAAGFIGYYVCKLLAANNIDVVGVDNINDYYDVNLKYARLEELGITRGEVINNVLLKSKKYHCFDFLKMDIVNYESLKEVFCEKKIDQVIHLAAQAGVRYSIDNPHAYVQSNLVGFVNVLECCRHNDVKHLVYASSSSVYGNNKQIPFFEDDRVDYPISIYAATKKSNELLAHTYSHLYNLSTTGLRFFTVYGPWGRPDMAPILFANAITNNEPIKVFNYGDMERDFTYVEDIVEGILKVLNHPPKENSQNRPFYDILNIGNSFPVKLIEFIEELEKSIGVAAILKKYPMQPGDVKVTYADTTRLHQLTGYSPQTSLKVGLDNFVKWYKDYFKVI